MKRWCLIALLAGVLAAPAGAQTPPDSVTYVVRAGDTLYRIAARHGISVADLRVLNGLEGTDVQVGQRLLIRARERGPAGAPGDSAATPPLGRIVARAGDTYYTIGARLGVSADTLWLLNEQSSAPLLDSTVVRLPAAYATAEYTVRRGDTLFGIAKVHGVEIGVLRAANGLRGDELSVGQVLQVPLGDAPPRRAEAELPAPTVSGPVTLYPASFAGRVTAGGAPYAPERYTVSHQSLPLGAIVHLTHPATRRTTFAQVTDRGPLDADFIMDVSSAVADALGVREGDRVEVRLIRP